MKCTKLILLNINSNISRLAYWRKLKISSQIDEGNYENNLLLKVYYVTGTVENALSVLSYCSLTMYLSEKDVSKWFNLGTENPRTSFKVIQQILNRWQRNFNLQKA